jgi:putative YpdA family bacillithiol system oxidoreductase
VSCHTEHRGRTFNIRGGKDLCWNCHEKGLGIRSFSARPMKVYYEQIAVPAGATESKSGKVVDPLRLQLPATEAARRKLQQSVSAEESGLIYGHAIHEKDVKKANYTKGVACFDCHKQIPDVGGISFPTHAECIECHKEVGNRDPKEATASASEQCRKCHLSREGGITRIQRKITYVQFSHNDHTETTCNRCHFIVRDEQAYRPVLRSAVLYPLPMEACYSCHEQRRATTACLDCHREHHSYPDSYPVPQVPKRWLSNLSLGSVILTLLVGVVGAGAYTYFDTRLVRNWLESSDAPPPTEAREASSSPTPAPPAKDGVMPFPTVDAATCISCHGCYDSCPTKVLAGDPVTAKSTVVDPKACKSLEGCRICEEKCPTGAIRVTLAPLQREVERAQIDEHNESNIPGLFLAGEVIGAALIKKAVNQGDQISRYIAERKPRVADAPYDVVIVGAGPAGLGAGLEAQRHGLRYLLLERGTIASTIRDYPRDKAVLAEPVLLPQYGLLKMMDTKKETLIAEWENVIRTSGLRVNEREEVLDVKKTDGLFTVTTGKGTYQGAYVILGIGTRGNPRKIGVPREDLPKVAYHLIDAAEFKGQKVLVVGGGDSAIEAAVALANEEGTVVTLSYRQAKFSRIKSRNADAIAEQEKAGRVAVIFNSNVTKITERSVTLKVGEEERELENDAVFALIGGDPPKTWLQKTGVNIVTVKETVGAQW